MAKRVKIVGDTWILEKRIGSGSFASVFLAKHQHDHEKQVAIKAIRRNKLNKKLASHLQKEIVILQDISHVNVVRLIETHESTRHIYLVMEYCKGGDLHKYLGKHIPLEMPVVQRLMTHLARGMYYLWSCDLIHRDLKPQNLLLDGNILETATLKIADFGFATQLTTASMAQTMCGSPLYMAPEILDGQKYDSKADLWSAGTILYEMVVGTPPFRGGSPKELLRNILRSTFSFPSDIIQASDECVNLLRGLLKANPKQRIGFQEFCTHPFLVDASIDGHIDQPSAMQVSSDDSSLLNSLSSDDEKPPEEAWEFVDTLIKPKKKVVVPEQSLEDVQAIRYVGEIANRVQILGDLAQLLIDGITKATPDEEFITLLHFDPIDRTSIGCVLLGKCVSIFYDILKITATLSEFGTTTEEAARATIIDIESKYKKFLSNARTYLDRIAADELPCAEKVIFDIVIQLAEGAATLETQNESLDIATCFLNTSISLMELLCSDAKFAASEKETFIGFLVMLRKRKQAINQRMYHRDSSRPQ